MAIDTIDSDSDAQSFHSLRNEDDEQKQQNGEEPGDEDPSPPKLHERERFPPEEEQKLLASSNEQKTAANQLFGKGSYESAIQKYDVALTTCPNYLDYEIAVLRSNMAACHVRLQEWKEAIETADKGIECLERLEKLPVPKRNKRPMANSDGTIEEAGPEQSGDGMVEEVDDQLEERIENLRLSGHSLDEVRKLQVKLLLRRAKARTETGGWASLQGAEEDYTVLLQPSMAPFLTATDKQVVMRAVKELGPKLNVAKEREMAEMMGKLKGLGNSILKPFGLSTENFQFVKDEKTGGYSMNFNQSSGRGS